MQAIRQETSHVVGVALTTGLFVAWSQAMKGTSGQDAKISSWLDGSFPAKGAGKYLKIFSNNVGVS